MSWSLSQGLGASCSWLPWPEKPNSTMLRHQDVFRVWVPTSENGNSTRIQHSMFYFQPGWPLRTDKLLRTIASPLACNISAAQGSLDGWDTGRLLLFFFKQSVLLRLRLPLQSVHAQTSFIRKKVCTSPGVGVAFLLQSTTVPYPLSTAGCEEEKRKANTCFVLSRLNTLVD